MLLSYAKFILLLLIGRSEESIFLRRPLALENARSACFSLRRMI